jgi:hypothetical protein
VQKWLGFTRRRGWLLKKKAALGRGSAFWNARIGEIYVEGLDLAARRLMVDGSCDNNERKSFDAGIEARD